MNLVSLCDYKSMEKRPLGCYKINQRENRNVIENGTAYNTVTVKWKEKYENPTTANSKERIGTGSALCLPNENENENKKNHAMSILYEKEKTKQMKGIA